MEIGEFQFRDLLVQLTKTKIFEEDHIFFDEQDEVVSAEMKVALSSESKASEMPTNLVLKQTKKRKRRRKSSVEVKREEEEESFWTSTDGQNIVFGTMLLFGIVISIYGFNDVDTSVIVRAKDASTIDAKKAAEQQSTCSVLGRTELTPSEMTDLEVNFNKAKGVLISDRIFGFKFAENNAAGADYCDIVPTDVDPHVLEDLVVRAYQYQAYGAFKPIEHRGIRLPTVWDAKDKPDAAVTVVSNRRDPSGNSKYKYPIGELRESSHCVKHRNQSFFSARNFELNYLIPILSYIKDYEPNKKVFFHYISGPEMDGSLVASPQSLALILLWAATYERSVVLRGVSKDHMEYFLRLLCVQSGKIKTLDSFAAEQSKRPGTVLQSLYEVQQAQETEKKIEFGQGDETYLNREYFRKAHGLAPDGSVFCRIIDSCDKSISGLRWREVQPKKYLYEVAVKTMEDITKNNGDALAATSFVYHGKADGLNSCIVFSGKNAEKSSVLEMLVKGLSVQGESKLVLEWPDATYDGVLNNSDNKWLRAAFASGLVSYVRVPEVNQCRDDSEQSSWD